MDLGLLRRRRSGMRLGHTIFWRPEASSTNRELMEMAISGEAASGAVMLADFQTAGRGREGRSWHSPPGLNVYLSLLLDSAPQGQVQLVPFAAGIALADAVEEITGLQPILKWPNDLLFDGRKLSGILAEMKPRLDGGRWVVIGVGLNVNMEQSSFPPDLRGTATSLRIAAGRDFDRSEIVASFLAKLEALMFPDGNEPDCNECLSDRWIAEWSQRDGCFGRLLEIKTAGGVVVGRGEGITRDGALRIRLEDGNLQTLFAGDVELLRVERDS